MCIVVCVCDYQLPKHIRCSLQNGTVCTVDREIFAFKYFRVINVRVSNFCHKVQEVKIIHCVFYFRVLNFRRSRERRKIFNGEYFPIYGTCNTLNMFPPSQGVVCVWTLQHCLVCFIVQHTHTHCVYVCMLYCICTSDCIHYYY